MMMLIMFANGAPAAVQLRLICSLFDTDGDNRLTKVMPSPRMCRVRAYGTLGVLLTCIIVGVHG